MTAHVTSCGVADFLSTGVPVLNPWEDPADGSTGPDLFT